MMEKPKLKLALILDPSCEVIGEYCASITESLKIMKEKDKIVDKIDNFGLEPLERKKIVSKYIGNWLIQREDNGMYYII